MFYQYYINSEYCTNASLASAQLKAHCTFCACYFVRFLFTSICSSRVCVCFVFQDSDAPHPRPPAPPTVPPAAPAAPLKAEPEALPSSPQGTSQAPGPLEERVKVRVGQPQQQQLNMTLFI